MVRKFNDMYSRFDILLACDGRTNIVPQHSPRYAYLHRPTQRTVKKLQTLNDRRRQLLLLL